MPGIVIKDTQLKYVTKERFELRTDSKALNHSTRGLVKRFHGRPKPTYWSVTSNWALVQIWMTTTLIAVFRVCTGGLTITVHYAAFVNV